MQAVVTDVSLYPASAASEYARLPTITSRKGRGFHYQAFTRVAPASTRSKTPPNQQVCCKPWEPKGSYNYTVLVPLRHGVGAVAVYVLEARIGALYYPLTSWDPIIIREAHLSRIR